MKPDFYYFDSSALIKRYVEEIGSAWVRQLLVSGTDKLVITSRLTVVEVRSAFARRRREMTISEADHRFVLFAFQSHGLSRYRFVDVDERVIDMAGDLLDRHPLRSYDAVQLASALLVHKTLNQTGLPTPTFLSGDNRLLNAATAEGLTVDNPNLHP